MKKKAAKKIAKKKTSPKKKVSPKKTFTNFESWWTKIAEKKVSKMEKAYLKEYPDYDPEEELGGDSSYVHAMFHEGEAHNMTYDIAEEVFNKALSGEKFNLDQTHSLYCELDEVITEAQQAGYDLRKAQK